MVQKDMQELFDWRKEFPIGTRVAIVGDHPWVHHSGVIFAHEEVGFLKKQIAVVVRLDGMSRAGVLHASNLRKL